jgi:hypothetical protein
MNSSPPRYILEKRPNLLSCTLLLPLVDESLSEEAALAIATKIGSSTRTGPLPLTVKHKSLRAPSMTVKHMEDGTSIVRVFAPFIDKQIASEYIAVEVDCKIDVDRSVLTLHGDHLAARLAFTEFSSARDARDGKKNGWEEKLM